MISFIREDKLSTRVYPGRLLGLTIAAVFAAQLSLRAAESPKKATADQVKIVEFFIKTPVSQLPPDRVDDFMAVDVQTLPVKLREPYKARQLELYTLKHLAANNKKGLIRMPEKSCAIPDEAKSDKSGIMRAAGFMEIKEDEEQMLLEKTQCTERDLMCESSLQIVVERVPKTNKVKRRRYFLYTTDPLTALVAGYRSGKNVGGNTNFFSKAAMLCSH